MDIVGKQILLPSFWYSISWSNYYDGLWETAI